MGKDTELFSFKGFQIPVPLVNKTGGGPESFSAISQVHIRILQDKVGINAGDVILEVGCGIGRDAIPLTEILTSGRYIGTDVIEDSIHWCRDNISVKFPNFSFYHHNIKDDLHNPEGTVRSEDVRLPAADRSVDLIILQSVFTHMFENEIIHYLREFRRVLQPSGRVFASVFIIDQRIADHISRTWPQGHQLNFQEEYGPGCYVSDGRNPRGAVAYTEEAISRMINSGGLELAMPPIWGTWSGQRENAEFGQDALILRRPSGA